MNMKDAFIDMIDFREREGRGNQALRETGEVIGKDIVAKTSQCCRDSKGRK